MERMLGPKRPFYKAGPVMRLEKIPADVFAAFIEPRFTQTGIRPEPGLGAAVVDLAGNLPYDVQRLAHETWDDARRRRAAPVRPRRPARDAAPAARRAGDVFEAIWQRLTLAQRARAARGRARGRTRAAVGRRAPPSSPRRRRRACRPRSARCSREDLVTRDGEPLRRRRFAAAGVGRAEDLLMLHPLARHAGCSGLDPSCARGRCTTGPTRPSSAPSSPRSSRSTSSSVAGRRPAAGGAPPADSRTATTIALAIIAVAVADPRRARRLRRREEADAGDLPGHRRRPRPRRCASSAAGDWLLAAVLFVVANIGVYGSFVFYDSLLPHIAATTRSTACRPPATRSATSAAACCSLINLALDPEARAGSACADAGVGVAPVVPQRRGLVARVLDPAVPPRAGAAGAARAAAARRRPDRARRSGSSSDTLRELRALSPGRS